LGEHEIAQAKFLFERSALVFDPLLGAI
jgi:hypothetical protein